MDMIMMIIMTIMVIMMMMIHDDISVFAKFAHFMDLDDFLYAMQLVIKGQTTLPGKNNIFCT